TFVPVLSVWLLDHHEKESQSHNPLNLFDRFIRGYGWVLSVVMLRRRGTFLALYLAGSAAVLLFLLPRLGTEIFPNVDSGQFQLRVRAPVGMRIERTEELARETLRVIGEEVGPDNVD